MKLYVCSGSKVEPSRVGFSQAFQELDRSATRGPLSGLSTNKEPCLTGSLLHSTAQY